MTTPPTAAIVGLCCVAPPAAAAQQDTARFFIHVAGLTGRDARFAETIFSRSGIHSRGSVLLRSNSSAGARLDQSFFEPRTGAGDNGPTTAARMRAYEALASGLGIAAATGAMRCAAPLLGALAPRDVTHLLTVSCTGLAAPGLDVDLIDALGLSPGVRRVNLGFMGCHGGVIGLRTAGELALAAGPAARVLLVCVELCSLHQQYSDRPDQIVANALFADGAAAAVVARDHRPPATTPAPTGPRPLAIRSAASLLISGSRAAMGWRIGDHGFHMTLAESVPDVIRANLGPWMFQWLHECGISQDRARSQVRWAVHPGGPKVLTAVADALGLRPETLQPSRDVLADHGNMSSPTVLFILDRIRQHAPAAAHDSRDSPIVLLGFGPGLTAEALLLQPMK